MPRTNYVVALALTLAACANAEGTGDLGYPCYPNGTCNEGLVCLDRVCRDPNAPIDAGFDAGAMDGGVPVDAGHPPDAASSTDAGPPRPDAFVARDAGLGDDDGGLSVDGGLGADAGPDAGPGLDLPLEHTLPASTVMTTVTRLGHDAFVLVSVRNSDASTPESEQIALELVRRRGHTLAFEAPELVADLTTDPGFDNPLHLIGALGSEHFFFILMRPDNSLVLRYFAHRDGTFVDLGSTPLAAGGPFGATPGFFHGHPVDDTRHLLGYREGNSGQPYRYRLLIRAGDTFRLGPPTTRPPSSAFVGLATTESQTDPALLRVGPTTFVEARPGYVGPPGYLGSWTLDVNPDDTLTATAPTVHSTVTRTMIPEVAADGRGGALIALHSYMDTTWQHGVYAHADRSLGDRGALGVSNAVSIRAHQGESTDRHLGGSYYLRLPGDTTRTAPLFRVAASDGAVERLADVPGLYECYRSPQMVRAGAIAAYTGCDRVVFLDLLPTCGDLVRDSDEGCDDGNNLDGDGCSAGCTVEPS